MNYQVFGKPKFWLYLFFILIAAFISQVAEFTHLKYAQNWLVIYAILTSISFAVAEYFISVPANRYAYNNQELQLSYNQIQTIWNTLQILCNGLIGYFYFQKFSWNIGVSYVFLFLAVVIAFYN
jgi:uncharacterized protein (DUF486 family)